MGFFDGTFFAWRLDYIGRAKFKYFDDNFEHFTNPKQLHKRLPYRLCVDAKSIRFP